jgi:LmbE family N-acetylglucosaminyl deacetylase
MRQLIISALFFLFSFNPFAQSPQSWTSAEMYQAIKKLNVLGSVLYVAAHPDDENTRLIAYLSKDRLYRTGYLSITRGDGGQNLIGDEQGIELGLIRTQELLAARRIDGGEQFFTRAFDFGYSKSPEETFTKWDKEKILSDVVWVIRKFQPDVIINRFPVTGEGGHGHHTASGILANEAFDAAADPKRFPEQLKYVSVWQTKRVLWNTFNFGGNNTTRDDQFKLDVGGYNPLLGKSYGEISAESRSQHKSQGFGVPASRGEQLEYFKATKGDQPVSDLMEGIDLTWSRVSGGEIVQKMIDSIAESFDFIHPEKSVKGLMALYVQMRNMLAASKARSYPKTNEWYWYEKKMSEVEKLIEQCSGLFIDVTTTEQYAVQTDSVKLNFTFNNRLGTGATLLGVSTDGFDSTLSTPLGKNRNVNFSKTIFIPGSKNISQPYWLVEKKEEGYFNVSSQEKIGQADVDPAYLVTIKVKIFGELFSFNRPVQYKFTDPVRGEIYWPLVVVNPVVVSSTENLKLVLPKTGKSEGVVRLKAMRKGVSGKLTGYESTADNLRKTVGVSFSKERIDLKSKNEFEEINFTKNALNRNENLLIGVYDSLSSAVYANDLVQIKYDHIPFIHYFKEAGIRFQFSDFQTHGKKIGYIIGAGDKVPEALEQMGYEVTFLGDKELGKNNLSQFDAIITGVRAYNTHDWMNKHYDKLMKYVNDGGNLIVQYNTSSNLGPVRAKIGPYHFNITRNRVTDENSKVTLLKPDHPAFNFPNKITDDDFKGWVQERSIYHASDTSGKFEKLIGMADPGEKSDDGSLIVTKYGKGWFTYTGLVFFRELPAGVPGAYRLLANLIALNKKKGF